MPVVLAVPRRRYARLADEFSGEVDLRLLDWPRHSSLSNPRFLVEITRLVRRERPDVIHMLSNTALWLNAAMPFWRGPPLVTTVHDVEVHPGDAETAVLPQWATSLAVRQSDDIIVHGERLRASPRSGSANRSTASTSCRILRYSATPNAPGARA